MSVWSPFGTSALYKQLDLQLRESTAEEDAGGIFPLPLLFSYEVIQL